MPRILLEKITSVEGAHEHVDTYKNCFIDLLKEIADTYDSSTCDALAACGAYLILEESILELVKNSIDAGAKILDIRIHSLDREEQTIAFAVSDNGKGFTSKDNLGMYPIEADELGDSVKAGDSTKMGGCNKGNLQTSYALRKNGGYLWRENITDESGKIIGAQLIFCSSLKPCCYSVVNYQDEFCKPKVAVAVPRVSTECIKIMLTRYSPKIEAMKLRASVARAREKSQETCDDLRDSPAPPMANSFDISIAELTGSCVTPVSGSEAGSAPCGITPVLPGTSYPSPVDFQRSLVGGPLVSMSGRGFSCLSLAGSVSLHGAVLADGEPHLAGNSVSPTPRYQR